MKFVLCFALILLVVVSAQNQQVNSLGELFGSVVQNFAAPAQSETAVQKGDCMSLAFDLLTFLYNELQNVLASGKIPDQMYLMMQGFVAMTKFNAAKDACFPSAQ